ncbi:MAG TPA: alanine--tRNA ligase, partial [Gemmatimonadales bacterium]
TDDEARALWRKITGIADARIYGLGDKDNFWQMADTGPAGPNTELNVDLRPRHERGRGDVAPDEFVRLNDAGRMLEIWNLVFMQYDLQPDGSRHPLPKPSVDTGAGLERIAAVLQGVPSNFDTDLFAPIIQRAVEVVGLPYDRGPAGAPYRVLADHARAVAFLLADGVYPSSDGRGYVLRRILRRGVRHAWLLGRREPTLVELTERVVEQMRGTFPELEAKRAHIARVTRAEEDRFLETIEGGLKRLDELAGSAAISGEEAFRLYDTYGFPLDLTQLIAAERKQQVDAAGFERALAEQRRRSRAARGGGPAIRTARRGEWVTVKPMVRQHWVGYEHTSSETDVLAFRQMDDSLELVLEENPFYAESGGQVSDTGVVAGEGWELTVEDVEKTDGTSAVVGHFSEPFEPTAAQARVNRERRHNIERNHTATHLVHAALRRLLGTHVRQAGSVVAPERLRFDFTHHGPIDKTTLGRIEETVNEQIWRNLPVTTREMAYKDAIAAGAMAFFSEKYGDRVRVVDVPDFSLELCGGTHVGTTGEIALFRFTHETGSQAGVRRIEAITGPAAYRLSRDLERRLGEASAALKTQPEHLMHRIETLLEENRKLEKRVEELLRSGGAAEGKDAVEQIGDVTLFIADSDLEDRAQIALTMDAFRENHRRAVRVLFSGGPRPGIHVAVTEDLVTQGVKAGDIARELAASTDAKGGGKPHFASGGVGDAVRLPATRAATPAIVKRFLPA